jgi:hypothetical protein
MPLFETLFEMPSSAWNIDAIRADVIAAGFEATVASTDRHDLLSVIVNRPGAELSQADAIAHAVLAHMPDGSSIVSRRQAARIDEMSLADLEDLLATLKPETE